MKKNEQADRWQKRGDVITPEEAIKAMEKDIEALEGHAMPPQQLNRKQRRTLLATKVQKKILKKVVPKR